MNCFDRNRCHLGCVDLWDDRDLVGSEIPDHLDHGRSNEAMNFCSECSAVASMRPTEALTSVKF